jgi:hypothetical protein
MFGSTLQDNVPICVQACAAAGTEMVALRQSVASTKQIRSMLVAFLDESLSSVRPQPSAGAAARQRAEHRRIASRLIGKHLMGVGTRFAIHALDCRMARLSNCCCAGRNNTIATTQIRDTNAPQPRMTMIVIIRSQISLVESLYGRKKT